MVADAQELVSCVNRWIPMVYFFATGSLPISARSLLVHIPLLPTTDKAANLDEDLPDFPMERR